ncbi:MAG: FAD-dependent oxidoreductase, partial [Burkholderiaceae bacterium]
MELLVRLDRVQAHLLRDRLARHDITVHLLNLHVQGAVGELPPEASAALQAALEALGVHFDFGCTVHEVGHAAGRLQVTLATGETVPADAVLSAVGLRADTALAQASGLQVDRAIVVNTFLQTSATHIYALGDSAQFAVERGCALHP